MLVVFSPIFVVDTKITFVYNFVAPLTTCIKCLEQYVVSAIKFKSRLRIHKSDIETKKDRCGTARHFNNKCCNSSNPFIYLRALRKYIVSLMIVILKIFYGIKKNIGIIYKCKMHE